MRTRIYIGIVQFAVLVFSPFFMSSCLSDEGEFRLTGNIEKYIPEESYSLEQSIETKSDGMSYLILTPKLNEKFAFWGLNLQKVEYYENGELLMTANGPQGEFSSKITDLGVGRHEIIARMTIQGETCDDVILEDLHRGVVK